MRRFVFSGVLGAALAISAPSRADQGNVQILFGVTGEVEVDDLEYQVNGVEVPIPYDDDDDLEDQIGIAGMYLFSLGSDEAMLGPRIGYMSADTDEGDNDVSTLDLGLMFRYEFPTNKVRPFLDVGAGFTYGWIDIDNSDVDVAGPGWHLILGGGANFYVSESVAIQAGLYYERQAAHLKGDDTAGGIDYELEFDATASRFILAGGVVF